MRVLHLNTHSSGGSYQYAALLSTSLMEHGIESRVLCKDSQLPQSGRVLLDRVIRRLYVSLSTEPWHGTRRLLLPPSTKDLKAVDVVHLHVVADWFDVPHWLETLPRRIGVVIGVHGLWHFTGGCFLYRGCDRYANATDACSPCPILKTPLTWVLAKDEHRRKLHTYRNCRAEFVANSHWLAELARRSPIVEASGGVRVIPPGIDTAIFKPQDKKLCRKHLGLPPDAFVIITGCASLADTNKNVPWLLEQLSRLPDLDGVIVLAFGEGTVAVPDRLNVRFTGGIQARCDLARLLAAADVFVSASLMETYGLTLVEAMACGIPVVAFRVGAIPEAAPDGQVGFLCEPLDGTAFVAAIQRLQSSPQLRNELGTTASNFALTRNDKSQFAAAFAQFYRDSVKMAGTKQRLAAVNPVGYNKSCLES
jgi:glycosyltransferase involved in cell wall biosynthesis